MTDTRRPCATCTRNRAEKFFTSTRGRVCIPCQKKNRSKTSHASRVQSTYGLGPGDYEKLIAAQGGACAICKGTRKQNLSVDHDHTTGIVRGALCRRCNGQLLTAARNDSALLRAAADYLDRPPAHTVIGFKGKHAEAT